MIGHMILRKYYDGEDILGIKVVGGQPIKYPDPSLAAKSSNSSSSCSLPSSSLSPSSKLAAANETAAGAAIKTAVEQAQQKPPVKFITSYGAVVERVKKGSVAETEGHVRTGKVQFISIIFYIISCSFFLFLFFLHMRYNIP